MPENEFEKKVHDELQGFKLKPSEAVWEQVEAAIRKKKRKNLLLWLLLPLVLCGGLLILLMENGKKNSAGTVAQQASQHIGAPAPVNKKENTFSVNDKKAIDKNVVEEEPAVKEKPATKNEVTHAAAIESKPKKTFIKKNQPAIPLPYADNSSNDDLLSGERPQRNFPIETDTRVFNAPLSVSEKLMSAAKKEMKWEVQQSRLPCEEIEIRMDSLMHTFFVSSPLQNNKWEWSVSVKSGFSNNSENVFGIWGEEKAYDLSSLPNTGSGGQSMIPPSGTGAAFSFGVGVEVKKRLSNRTFLSWGLQYAQYSNSRKTGARVDSLRVVNNNFVSYTADYFYRAGNNSTYKSTYRFIEIPVRFHWKSDPRGRLSVSPEIGLTLVRLLASNGLVYSTSQHFYYNDKEIINKTQLHASAGIGFELFKKSRHPLTLGPYLQFGLTPHYNKNYGGRERIGFGGIRAVWSVKKK